MQPTGRCARLRVVQIDMNPAGVHSLGTKCLGLVDGLQTGVKGVGYGWTPGSDPEFKSSLLLCRQEWTFTFTDLRDAARSMGEKLQASANAVKSSDNASADQF